MESNMKNGLVYAQNFINGKFEDAAVHLDSYNPCTGKVWAKIPESDAATVDRAVAAAKTAFPAWNAAGCTVRARYLTKVADLLEQRAAEFATAESRDQGKTVALAANMDIPRAVLNIRSFAETWTHLLETANGSPDGGFVNYSTRSPMGVACLIAPWNLPLYLLTFKLAPALMSGNAVVCKPSEMTSVTAWMLAGLFREAGVPDGVFNLVCGTGAGAGEALVTHRDVNVVSFTGSTAVGKRIAGIAAPMMKKLSLELGGKNAALVFADADLDKAIPTLVRSCFLNQGEICLCTSRVFVHSSVYEVFLARFVPAVRALLVGDPEKPDTFSGALNSLQHLEKVRRYLGYAIEDGGEIMCGETKDPTPTLPEHLREGYFFRPTVITGLADDSRCMREEIFGPVACVAKFDSEEEVVDRTNDVDYGLCASVWSQNVGVVHRVSSKLHVGTVWANCWLVRSLDMPFGGCKQSGVGREGTVHSLEAYTEEKTICVKID